MADPCEFIAAARAGDALLLAALLDGWPSRAPRGPPLNVALRAAARGGHAEAAALLVETGAVAADAAYCALAWWGGTDEPARVATLEVLRGLERAKAARAAGSLARHANFALRCAAIGGNSAAAAAAAAGGATVRREALETGAMLGHREVCRALHPFVRHTAAAHDAAISWDHPEIAKDLRPPAHDFQFAD